MAEPSFHNPLYQIGCPVWGCPEFRGSVFPARAPKATWLKHYTRLFNTVEGNSTFYGIPQRSTFERWAEQSAPGFKFALKFPRAVSHDHMLVGAQLETDLFLDGLAALHDAEKLGTTFLQLGPAFGPARLNALANYLKNLPQQFRYGVEVRNHDWFDASAESELIGLLTETDIDYVIFDSRPLYSMPPTDEFEKASQKRKPRTPFRTTVTGRNPMLRLIGRNNVSEVQSWVDEWAEVVAEWIADGRQPSIFAHTPDDQHAPALARMFHNALAQRVPNLDPFDQWPYVGQTQMELF